MFDCFSLANKGILKPIVNTKYKTILYHSKEYYLLFMIVGQLIVSIKL